MPPTWIPATPGHGCELARPLVADPRKSMRAICQAGTAALTTDRELLYPNLYVRFPHSYGVKQTLASASPSAFSPFGRCFA